MPMITQYIISGSTLLGLFILFLVISKTVNNILSQLLKLEYMLEKEYEFREEESQIKRLILENIDDNRKVGF